VEVRLAKSVATDSLIGRVGCWLGSPAVAALLLLLVPGSGWASEEEALPEGPIRERHELMEGMAAHAKAISAANREGDTKAVVLPAQRIGEASARIAPLFPNGSLHPGSRAKPDIWRDFAEFEAQTKALGVKAAALAKIAREGGDTNAATKELMMRCKQCHEAFRKPKRQTH
jgi:cytochrome c556